MELNNSQEFWTFFLFSAVPWNVDSTVVMSSLFFSLLCLSFSPCLPFSFCFSICLRLTVFPSLCRVLSILYLSLSFSPPYFFFCLLSVKLSSFPLSLLSPFLFVCLSICQSVDICLPVFLSPILRLSSSSLSLSHISQSKDIYLTLTSTSPRMIARSKW